MGGNDHVEFVRIEPMLGATRGFVGCAEIAVAVEDAR